VSIGAALGAFILIIVIIIVVRCCCCAKLNKLDSKVPPNRNPFLGQEPFCAPQGVHDDEDRPHIYPAACVLTPYSTVAPRAISTNCHDHPHPPQAHRVGLISNLRATAIVNTTEEEEDFRPDQTIAGLSQLRMRVDPSSRDETVTDDSEGSVGVGWANRNSVSIRDFTEEGDDWLNNTRTR
jgi:hypothetical protein